MSETSLFRRATETIDANQMLEKTNSVLVALSGGGDSVALLHFLNSVKHIYGIKLYAAHVNHMIRGEEADRDEFFALKLCESFGIELFVGKYDIPSLSAEESTGLEETARKYRYKYLSELCADKEIKKIATAHTCSDSTETVLFNLVRGTGISGLKGIAPVRDNIIRPLISCTKAQVLDYCARYSLDYITDSTNLCTDYTRNFLRLEVLPLLGRINPTLDEAVARMSALLTQDNAYLESLADVYMRENYIGDTADIPSLLSCDPSLSSRVIMRMYGSVSSQTLGYVHVGDVFRLMRKSRTGSRVSLPDEVDASIEYGRLRIGKRAQTGVLFSQILRNGENRVDILQKKVTLSICTIDNIPKNVYNLFKSIYVDYDKIIGNISVRNRKNADGYIFGGHTRKLKKVLIDQKIPRDKRAMIPVFEDESGIIAVEGLPVCDRVKINSSTRRVLEICIHETD